MVTLKSSNDNDRPLGVVSGFSISNFKLGCTLVEVVCCFFVSCVDINVVNISLVRAYR